MEILLIPFMFISYYLSASAGAHVAFSVIEEYGNPLNGIEKVQNKMRSQKQKNVDFWIPEGDPRRDNH